METLAQQAPEAVKQRQGSSGGQVRTEAAIEQRQEQNDRSRTAAAVEQRPVWSSGQ